MREAFVETALGRVRVLKAGPERGPAATVCWPGLGLPAEAFWRVLREGGERGLRVAALDPPGHGRSDPAPALARPDAGRVLGAVAEHLGAERYLLVGHSAGAAACVMAAPALGTRLRALVVADGALERVLEGQGDRQLEAANRAYLDSLRQPGWPEALAWAQSELRAWDVDVEAGVRALFEPSAGGGLAGRGDLATLTRWAALVRDFDPLADAWPDVPVLAVFAARPEPPRALAALAARLRDLRARPVADAGHELFWDEAAMMADLVLGFARTVLDR